eukprot:scaffold259184_cov19-Tisochrysis_lutea.AAC.3
MRKTEKNALARVTESELNSMRILSTTCLLIPDSARHLLHQGIQGVFNIILSLSLHAPTCLVRSPGVGCGKGRKPARGSNESGPPEEKAPFRISARCKSEEDP